MRYLLDTGILARLPHRTDPLHQEVREAVRLLLVEGHVLVTSTQNMAEFWNLCTRPADARGGFGLTVRETAKRLRLLERFIRVLREPPTGYAAWKAIVLSKQVMGRQVHDARLAALMKSYRVKWLLTLNGADFGRYGWMRAIAPKDVIAHV
jgi:predicted nucleic acid-binding protein